MSKMKLENICVKSKRVLVRVDFNVPMENGQVVSDKRLRAAVPTISYLIQQGGKIILISHLGRPNGKRLNELSLRPCVSILSNLLGKRVTFLNECIGNEVRGTVDNMLDGQIILLENLRFHKQEVTNDIRFAKKLAELGDIYVNDAFGTIHRKHASIEGVTNFIDDCAMGFLVDKELSCINSIVTNPAHLFVVILGGSKVSDKLDVISNLLPKIDLLILGGGMAFTFLKAKGLEVGKSLFEQDKITISKEILKNFGEKILLPVDCLVTDSLNYMDKTIGNTKYVSTSSIEQGWYGIDIGKKTITKINDILYSAKTIIWNGPLGIFEICKATCGTFSVARAVAEAAKKGATTIVGGGDSCLAIDKAKVSDAISHVSTGGGASLKLIGGIPLPGITALTDRYL